MNEFKKDQNGDWIEISGGKPVICPFRNPIPVQGALAGQIAYMAINCSSACPFFEIKVKGMDGAPQSIQRLCVPEKRANFTPN